MAAERTVLEAEAIDFARALIRFDSVNTGDNATIGDGETRAARWVQQRLEEVGYATDFVEPIPGRGSLVARLTGRSQDVGALVVHAHLDVVPVDDGTWKRPPFAAQVEDGILYGRGAVDMKGFAGGVLAVARAFRRNGVVPGRDLVFVFVADEEAGGRWGARWIVENRPDLLAGATEALGEVGGFSVSLGPRRRLYPVATAEKGSLGATLVAHGPAGHGSRPLPGNAVVRLAAAIEAVAGHRFPVVRTPALVRFLDVVGRELGIEFRDGTLDSQLASLGGIGSFIGASARTTVSPTVLRAGDKTNVIPATAQAGLDIRVVPGGVALLREVLPSLVGDDVEVRWGILVEPIEAPADSALVDVLQRAVSAEDADGLVVPFLLPASTDNKAFARLGIHGYGFTPLRVPDGFDTFGGFHAVDERIPIDALAFGARVTERVLREA